MVMVRNGAFCLEGVAFAHNPHFLSSILLLAGFLQGPFASSRKGPPSIHFHSFFLMIMSTKVINQFKILKTFSSTFVMKISTAIYGLRTEFCATVTAE